ncbi:MAG: peptide-methionine (S)-S-oxide reductase MsrA [Dehalococcoidia bacterium]|nr:peptide-methionine (S)-S-oxide reductase MsrA [Dehalococcoidia bacterium]
MLFKRAILPLPATPEEALPGRSQAVPVPERHLVLGTPLTGPWPEGFERATFAMGCFWGTEKFMWKVPGVYSTFVGYTGGITPNPAYEEVCTQRTGHAEAAAVIFDPARTSYGDLLKVFWENHDPTQFMGQGNDVGTQYRSVLFFENEAQERAARASLERYQAELTNAGYGEITTTIEPAGAWYYAEPYHQQYLARNPDGYCNHGFCQAAYPAPASS